MTAAILRLQAFYCAMGIGYNIVGLVIGPLSATSPRAGIAVMLAYGLFLATGFLKKWLPYRVLMGVSLLVLGYGGVVVHLMNCNRMELYRSRPAWGAAIAINLFGAVLNALAAVRRPE